MVYAVCDDFDRYPLKYVIYRKNLNKLKELIDNGYDVNELDPGAISVLQSATINMNLDVMQVLIDGGADIHIQEGDTCPPLHYAVLETKTPLNLDVVQMLIKNGANVNERGHREHTTALHLSCIRAQSEINQVLIDNGADINIQDINGWTPLHHAVYHNNRNAIYVLLRSRNINVNTQNKYKETPLHFELKRNVPSVDNALLLLKNGLNPDIQDRNGKTAIEYVKDSNTKALIKMKWQLEKNGDDSYEI